MLACTLTRSLNTCVRLCGCLSRLIILGCSLTKASMNADSGALMGGGHEDDDGMELASAAGART